MPYDKICELCGQPFKARHPNSRICNEPHYRACVVCGKDFLVEKSYLKRQTCSKECASLQRKQNAQATSLRLYGVANAGYTEESQAKIKQTNKERYGVEYASQADSVKSKIAQSNLDRYGVSNPMQNAEIRKKAEQTNLERYGAKNPLCGDSNLKDSIDAHNLEVYGTLDPGNRPEAIEKRKQTNLAKYGVEYRVQDPEFIQQRAEQHYQKYGVYYPTQRPEVKAKQRETFMRRYGVDSPMAPQCQAVSSQTLSKLNHKFGELLETAGLEYSFEFRIENRSYDILIPDKHVVIEIDPTYSHTPESTLFGNVSPQYHKDKSRIAETVGYRCIHIWDWDDWYKIVGSLTSSQVVYARNCGIKEVSLEDCAEFLNSYHLQNTCRNQAVRLGLYYNDELIQIMTFGVPRYNKKFEYELLRLCTHPDFRVVGGANKLFKHFLRTRDPTSIISYCDRSKFTGDVYSKLGFNLKYTTEPAKHWSKGKQHITANLLRQRGFDQLFGTDYGKGTDNEQLMLNHGWLPIYDCGQAVYEWRR